MHHICSHNIFFWCSLSAFFFVVTCARLVCQSGEFIDNNITSNNFWLVV
jgi:hypothetical protein